VQDFKHIRAWQRAHALAIALHKLAQTIEIRKMIYTYRKKVVQSDRGGS